EVFAPERAQEDVIAWEGVVVDPDGLVDQAISRRVPFADKWVLEVGPSCLSHSVRHSREAVQVYAAEITDSALGRCTLTRGLPKNVNLIRFDSSGLPLRDSILDLVIVREPLLGSPLLSMQRAVPEVMRVLKPSAWCAIVSLSLKEGDLGALLDKMV